MSYAPAGTLIVTSCSSTSELEGGAQLLVGFTPGWIVPVHVDETVCPALDGTATELAGGVEATLEPASKQRNNCQHGSHRQLQRAGALRAGEGIERNAARVHYDLLDSDTQNAVDENDRICHPLEWFMAGS